MKKDRFFSFSRIFIMASLFLFGMGLAHAQRFLGTVDDLWSNPDNWLDGLKPTEESELVTIESDVVVDEDAFIKNLYDATQCTLTIQSGKKLTVIEQIIWDGGGDFILENDAQLVNDSPVEVTVKKDIRAYDENTHVWDVIASPIAEDVYPTIENGFITNIESGYALFSYDEASHSFKNYKESPFPITNGRGYLYANAFDTTLLLTGRIQGSSEPVTLSLDYHATNANLAGCNLVGNPLPCDAYPNRSYYVMDEASYRLTPVAASSATAVKSCSGIFVKADAQNESIAFSRNPGIAAQTQGYVIISVAKINAPNTTLDQAMVSFNPNDDLGKLQLGTEDPKLYFSEGNLELSIISVDTIDALPLKFKAVETGVYVLHVETKDLEVSTLRLIDNITGNQPDLLISPNYTFSASPNDYASRFKLVFDPHYGVDELGNEAFAYVSNGHIYINDVETCHGASLQVVDMTGRVVVSCDGCTQCIPTMGIAPGVYVLRLNDGNTIRTQKIIIE